MSEQSNSAPWARRRIWAIAALAAGAMGLYAATLSRGAFPGLPARSLCWHLFLDAAPTLLGTLWGRLVRVLAALPVGTPALWAGVASAAFGAACVALVAVLVGRVRYALHDKYDPDELRRESQARLLAGLTAGLHVALCVPFWIMSTRSLPGTFHLFLLLSAAFLFSEYQRTGRFGFLYGLGLVYGVGITEFATFIVFAPFAALLVVRAMLQRAAFSWPALVRTALCAAAGLLCYVWNGWTLFGDAAVRLRGFASPWSVIWYVWRDQWLQIVGGQFLKVALLTAMPWGVLFLLRAKKPAWRYSAWQTILRLAVLAVAAYVFHYLQVQSLLAALVPTLSADVSTLGFFFPMATPHLILSACAGTVAGEFWVMGQVREHRRAGIGQPLRTAMGVLGLLVPVAALAGGWAHLPVADGRLGTRFEALAADTLDALRGRDFIISNGVLDDSLRLLAERRGAELAIVNVPQTGSKLYRDYLSQIFDDPRQQALLQVGFGAFLQDFLADDAHLRRVAALDLADPLREYGYLVPDRLAYRVEPDDSQVDLPALIGAQRGFWAEMERLAQAPMDSRNPSRIYWQHAFRMASKVANNLGFALVERGQTEAAIELFHQARRIHPENVSALLNLLTIAQAEDAPEAAAYQEEWEQFKMRHVDPRVMWSLASLYGYVHNTGFLVRHGMMWAVSGKPRMAEAEMRRAARGGQVDAAVKTFLARAYLESGDVGRSESYYREALADNPRDARSLLMLVQLAMRADDFAEAERLLARAEELGVSPASLRFERAALAYLQGRPEDSLAALKALVAQDRENVRAWALLALMTAEGRDEKTYEQALKTLQGLRGTSPEVRLMLAELFIGRQDWTKARGELEQVVRMNPRMVRAWEMLVHVDFQERKRELAEDHVRVLLTLDPDNYLGNLLLGSFQYARGQYALAESSYRTALKVRREPAAMNDLAYLLIIRGGSLDEARALVDGALARQPDNPVFLSTRSELLLREERFDEAEADLQRVLSAMPDHPGALLLAAELYAARRQNGPALELVEMLADRQGELVPEQAARLQALARRLR